MKTENRSKVYIVIGSTGEYDDRAEWIVKVFRSLGAAKKFIIKAKDRADKIYLDNKESPWNWDSEKNPNEYDEKMQLDQAGTNYRCEVAYLFE